MAELKKVMAAFVAILAVSLADAGVGYAGDVPEGLLSYDHAQLYFGKVTAVTDTTVTIVPVKNVKGDIVLNETVTYKRGHMMGGGNEQVGKTYLVGHVDENNLYYWITDSMDPRTLKIKNASAMDLRLQGYLNNGDFEKAEEARQKKLAVTASPTAVPTVSPPAAPTVSRAPAPMNSSLPTNAELSDKPAYSFLPIVIVSLAGVLVVSAVFALPLIKNRKRRGRAS
jgi:hypothetical protein